jgi:hypothetical protein
MLSLARLNQIAHQRQHLSHQLKQWLSVFIHLVFVFLDESKESLESGHDCLLVARRKSSLDKCGDSRPLGRVVVLGDRHKTARVLLADYRLRAFEHLAEDIRSHLFFVALIDDNELEAWHRDLLGLFLRVELPVCLDIEA